MLRLAPDLYDWVRAEADRQNVTVARLLDDLMRTGLELRGRRRHDVTIAKRLEQSLDRLEALASWPTDRPYEAERIVVGAAISAATGSRWASLNHDDSPIYGMFTNEVHRAVIGVLRAWERDPAGRLMPTSKKIFSMSLYLAKWFGGVEANHKIFLPVLRSAVDLAGAHPRKIDLAVHSILAASLMRLRSEDARRSLDDAMTAERSALVESLFADEDERSLANDLLKRPPDDGPLADQLPPPPQKTAG